MYFKKILHTDRSSEFFKEVRAYETTRPWSTERSRIYVQKHTVNINLRKQPDGLTTTQAQDAQVDFLVQENYVWFKQTYAFLEEFAAQQKATLSRAMIVSLDPESEVFPHIDHGEYYKKRDRYHLVIHSMGSTLTAGGESATFGEGDLFWFDNKVTHSAVNPSTNRRIHIIFDLLPGRSPWILLKQYFEKMIAKSRFE